MNRIIYLLILMLVLGSMPERCLANDSALNDGAYGPEPLGWRPGAESSIRMVNEKLIIDFGPRISDVRVVFSFVNTSRTPARQLVGFPDLSAASAEARHDGEWWNMTGPIEDLVTLINGQITPTERQKGYVIISETGAWAPSTPDTGQVMVWWTMWVDFPPGDTVTVERRYRVKNGVSTLGDNWFSYTTATGAAWQGTIGKLTADVYLRDGLTADDFSWDHTERREWSMREDGWRRVTDTHLRLEWRDFEPARQRNRCEFVVRTRPVQLYNSVPEGLLFSARTGDYSFAVLGKTLTQQAAANGFLNCHDERRRTLLWWAVAGRRLAMVRELLDAGANPNLADDAGVTPLMTAARSGATDFVVLLLEHGATVGLRDRKSRSAYDYANYNDYSETARLLTGSLQQHNR